MGKSNEFKNPFEMAGHKSKKEEPAKKAVTPKKELKIPDNFHPEKDLEESFKKYQQMHDSLKKNIELICDTIGMSPQEIKKRAQSADLSKSEMKIEEETREQIVEKFGDFLEIEKEAKKAAQKAKKGKKSTAAKKGWLKIP